jgi:hypothetical protein
MTVVLLCSYLEWKSPTVRKQGYWRGVVIEVSVAPHVVDAEELQRPQHPRLEANDAALEVKGSILASLVHSQICPCITELICWLGCLLY